MLSHVNGPVAFRTTVLILLLFFYPYLYLYLCLYLCLILFIDGQLRLRDTGDFLGGSEAAEDLPLAVLK